MNKVSNYIVKLCFWIWLACSVLPTVLGEYKPFELLFKAGGYLSNGFLILSVFIFILTLIPFKPKTVAETDPSTIILHDLEPVAAQKILGDIPNAKYFCASRKMAACKGYYDCWLRTPGRCALHDGFEGLGQQIAACDNFVIISKNLYGGFSKEIKNALDRSISFALPFFQFRKGEVHHQARINKTGHMSVYIYDSDYITDYDKNSIVEIAKANGLNLNKSEPQVVFVKEIEELKVRYESTTD